jgi:hypothetical protein
VKRQKYIHFREQYGPIVPPGAMYEDVSERMADGDWSFLKQNWFFTFDGGVLYVPEKSELAQGMKLPVRIQMREDLKTGQIYIFSAPLTGTKAGIFSGLAALKAPEFMPYEKDFPLDRYLLDEFSPRRIVWEVTLKSETDAWADLILPGEETGEAKLLDGGGMMAMMGEPPPEHTNDLWLCLDPQNEQISLSIFAPDWFTNRVEVYSCTDLVTGLWSVVQQNLYPGTNPAVWNVTSGITNRFFRAGNMDIDTDSDGLPDAREKYVHKTDPGDDDTDGDGMPDGWELQYGLDPLFYADGGFDPDGDGANNLAEYTGGTHPQIANVTLPDGAQGSLIFRYDDDGRLTGSHFNSISAVWYGNSPAHNTTDLNVYTD